MAPIRRYLRITKYSVLECRIYLDNPALAQSWLLNPRKPVLPRVIESVRPLVLPKLREEKERNRKKGTKKKAIKDVVTEDDFEVSIFLTETSTRHSLLKKHKHFRDKVPGRLQSNSSKLISETNEAPIDVDEHVPILREESDEEFNLDTIPAADEIPGRRRNKRHRGETNDSDSDFEAPPQDSDDDGPVIEINSDTEDAPPTKRPRRRAALDEEADDIEDKKKMAMDISYEGFAIYGLVLCLVVKKRETATHQLSLGPRASAGTASGSNNKPTGHAMMENWITSTQMPAGAEAAEATGS